LLLAFETRLYQYEHQYSIVKNRELLL